MAIAVFTSSHTKSLYENNDIEGLKLKLKNAKTKTLGALLDGMEAKHPKTGPAPSPVLALASLYRDARAKDAALPQIKDVWLAADAYLAVHQEARVDSMGAPDAKKPATNKGKLRFAIFDEVQKFDKAEAPNKLNTLAFGQLQPSKADGALRKPKETSISMGQAEWTRTDVKPIVIK